MCVEKRIDTPSCSQSVRNVSSSSSREMGSRPDVGSSRISSSALCDIATASWYLTFMPSDSSHTRLLSSSENCRTSRA